MTSPSVIRQASAATGCPLEKAHYVIRDEQGMSAGFLSRQGGAPNLVFYVHSDNGNKTAWFLPRRENGAPYLRSTTDIHAPGWRPDGPRPFGDLSYSVTDSDGRTLPGFWFYPGVEAPAHIVVPRLQEVLLYGWVSDSKESISLAFLDLDSCR